MNCVATEYETLLHIFKYGTIDRKCWNHAAHLVVATWYCMNHEFDEALSLVRDGIKAFNIRNGGENTEDAGYHETLTVFWMVKVSRHVHSLPSGTSFVDAATSAMATFSNAVPLLAAHYSYDVIKDREARAVWKTPDLNPLPSKYLRASSGVGQTPVTK